MEHLGLRWVSKKYSISTPFYFVGKHMKPAMNLRKPPWLEVHSDHITLPKTNIALEHGLSPKKCFIFQLDFFHETQNLLVSNAILFPKKHTSKTSSQCFIQVSIVSDMFMNSIEEITSRSKQAELDSEWSFFRWRKNNWVSRGEI